MTNTNGIKIDGHHDNNKQTKKLLFAFFPLEAQGHINPAISMANELKKRGHDTVFLCINDIGYTGHPVVSMKKILEEKEAMNTEQKNGDIAVNGQQKISEADKAMTKRMNEVRFGINPPEDLKNLFIAIIDIFKELSKPKVYKTLRVTIEELKPDVIMVDHGIVPAIMDPSLNQKWVRVVSTNPLQIYSHKNIDLFPAPSLGARILGITKEERELTWKIYLDARSVLKPTTDPMLEMAGIVLENEYAIWPSSPHLNLYICPRELDYDQELGGQLEGWVRIQSMNRPSNYEQLFIANNNNDTRESLLSKLDIPDELRDFIKQDDQEEKKKLLYLSLGTIACMDVKRMRRLVSLFSKTPYKIIVSKGARHNEFDLAPNMWGAKHVPQKEILLLVDLVITHGGNNTITECLYSGVPGIIVCPMFCDQYDNATRMEEKRLGIRVDLANAEELLLGSIEKVLADKEMSKNIKRVSAEMRQPGEGPDKAADSIEKLALA